jgi:membrane protein DedA with SNARE-associated domain
MTSYSFIDQALGTPLLYPAIFILLLLNGLLSFPSSQILYLFLGYFFAQEKNILFFIALWGATGNAAGNIILHTISQKKGAPFIKKIYKNMDSEIEKILPLLKRRGYSYVFLGKLIPAVKVFIPLATSLLPFKKIPLFCTFFVSSFLWALGFLFVGAFIGENSSLPKIYTFITVLILIFISVKYKKKIQDFLKNMS